LRTITLDLAKEESRERILSRNEMGLLVANAGSPLKHVILVALNTVIRKAEIYNLEWVNVNLEHNFITVTAQEAKNKVFLHSPYLLFNVLEVKVSQTLQVATSWACALNCGLWVFVNGMIHLRKPSIWSEGPYAARDAMRRAAGGWRSALERAEINDMRFHDLRHTFASHFLMNGGDLYTLKEILGHKDITTTSRYLTITTEPKSKAMEIFEVPENESNIIELMG
jgi:integrase